MTATVIAVANHKGGVGKTTVALLLAHAAVAQGQHVLVIDHDAQGNAELRLRDDRADRPHLADLYAGVDTLDLTTAIRPTRRPGLDVLPSGRDRLASAVQALTGLKVGRLLHTALEPIREQYDLILIDCDRGLSLGTINALNAADRVLMVTQPEQDSFNGIFDTGELVDDVNDELRPGRPLPNPHIVINLHDTARTASHGKTATHIRTWAAENDYPIGDHDIPRRAFIGDAAEQGIGLDQIGGANTAHVIDVLNTLLHDLTH